MSLPTFLRNVERLGYKVFTSGQYNLNLIGVRSSATDAGKFDDWITCWYKNENDQWVSHWWAATTDPGDYWLENPMNVDGTAIMVPGQYRGLWKVGQHKGYKAFQQAGSVSVYRDDTRDRRLHTSGPIDSGFFGINGHASDSDPWDSSDRIRQEVGRWSAGCQVWADSAGFREAVELAEKSIQIGFSNSFTYTLVQESDVL